MRPNLSAFPVPSSNATPTRGTFAPQFPILRELKSLTVKLHFFPEVGPSLRASCLSLPLGCPKNSGKYFQT